MEGRRLGGQILGEAAVALEVLLEEQLRARSQKGVLRFLSSVLKCSADSGERLPVSSNALRYSQFSKTGSTVFQIK